MILLFSALTSVGLPASASPQAGKIEGGNPYQGDSPALQTPNSKPPTPNLGLARPRPLLATRHLQPSISETGWKAPPVRLSPPWFSPSLELTNGIEQETPPIEPDLLRALLEAEPDTYIHVIVRLREQTDLEAAVRGAASMADVRIHLVSALQADAARAQAPLRAYLEGARASGSVASYTPFWIFNGIAVRARPSLIRALAAHPTVATIHLDHYRQWLTAEIPQEIPNSKPQTPNPLRATRHSQLTSPNLQSPASSIEWGIARVRADEVWTSLNISGTGAVVAGMDTGADWLHPALQANYRGYNPHGPTNHTYSWYDATDSNALYPVDGHGHGSHTLGTIAGQGGIGVAPGARWIAIKVLNNQGYGYDSWIRHLRRLRQRQQRPWRGHGGLPGLPAGGICRRCHRFRR